MRAVVFSQVLEIPIILLFSLTVKNLRSLNPLLWLFLKIPHEDVEKKYEISFSTCRFISRFKIVQISTFLCTLYKNLLGYAIL